MAVKKKKRMRLPNGIGSVHLINDGKRRRNPWRARVPSHIEINEETGKVSQKYINIGYYPTEEDAIAALFEYRKNPYTIEASTCTFSDVYEMWKNKKFPTVSASAQRIYSAAFKHSAPLHDMKMRDIRAKDMELVMATTKTGYHTQCNIKLLWGQMNKYAMEHDIIQKDYSAFVSVRDKEPETTRTAISKEHILKLWECAKNCNETAEIALIYIYTGLRANELLEALKSNVDTEKRMLIAGKKTESGKNRKIPLHKDILPFIIKRMQEPVETLITDNGNPVEYVHFKKEWVQLMQEIGADYTIHYTRHTFATLMREANVAEDIKKVILGHKSADITDRYTHISDEMLINAIDKLKIK